ncbi:MAG TPA: glutathione S-transferase domain-containing protein [Polyangiaceae bacterium]|nr:glutathione S-transferase domain-containing protein [Polyangiaceae bacterium]
MFWESCHWQPVLTRFLAARVRQLLFPDSNAPHSETEWQHPELVALLNQVETALSGKQFLCADEPSIADFSVAGMTTYFRAARFPADH